MRKTLSISLLLAMLMLNACNKKTENLEEPITTSLKETKKVEIFRLSSDIPNLSFETNGTIEAKNKATITNEITGKLKEINVKVGDKVEENQVLFQLGDSLNTDTIKTQHEIALKNLELTNKSASLNLENAYNNADLAKISYENSISNKYDVIRNYETQLESLYHQIDQAEENYEDAKDYYKDNKEDFDEVSKKAAKQAKDNAKFQLEQLEMSLETFNANYFTQVDQVEFSIDSAKNQYQSSITQTEIIKNSSNSQILTAENNLTIAKNNLNKTTAYSPIKGKVSKIYFNENDFVNVGSNIIEIENLDSLIIKTSINEEERSLINFDTVVEITNNLNTETAKIISISPTANQLTQKFDLEIELRNSSFIPGQNITINFIPTKQERIFIPSNSIYIKNNKTFIYTLNLRNQVVKTEIIIGNVIGSYTEVLSELDNSTRLVNSNIYSLEDNERIEIANPIKITRD